MSLLKNKNSTLPVHTVQFFLSSRFNAPQTARWAGFFAVLYHESLEHEAAQFWEHFGDGISSRHALFCLAQFLFLDSDSANHKSRFQRVTASSGISSISPLDWSNSALKEKLSIKSLLAKCATSRKPNQKPVRAEDVYLYPNGMCAISAVARGFARKSDGSGVVVYG